MARRWGPGPVFVFESVVASRRWPYYAARAVFGLALLVVLAFVWLEYSDALAAASAGFDRSALARVGRAFYLGVAGVQVSLILLAAPAATAGAVCLDRARGTLVHMMVTDLSDAEIVLGKLAARLAPVLALVATSTPVLALAGLLGGVIPEAVLTMVLVTLGLAVLGCSLAMLVSALVLKAHEVLLVVYSVLAFWLLSPAVWMGLGQSGWVRKPPDWFIKLNPYVLTFAPFESPGYTGPVDLAIFLAAAAGVSALLTVLAVRTLRREVTAGVVRSERWERWASRAHARLFSWWPSPTLDQDPVLWREWHRNRPSRIARRVWGLFVVLTALGTALAFVDVVLHGVRFGDGLALMVNGFGVTFGLLFLSASAPTVLTEERARGSLDVLLATPLSTRAILTAKWWSVFRVAPRLALAPGLLAFMIAASAEPETIVLPGRFYPRITPADALDRVAAAAFPVAWVLAHGAATASTGLALATWFSKPGRAISASVGLYIAATVGSVFAVQLVVMPLIRYLTWSSPGEEWLRAVDQGLLAFSPFGGQVVALEAVSSPWFGRSRLLWVVQGVMLAATLAYAACVFGLTLLTFNRCLGRVDENALAPTSPYPDVKLSPVGTGLEWEDSPVGRGDRKAGERV